jgi:hypothetical protein
MYPLTGSADATLEARMANFRLAQSRLGFMNPTLRLVINGTERQTQAEKGSIQITRTLNGPSTATLTVFGFVPVEGQSIIIATGAPTNRIFGGHITDVRQIHEGLSTNITYSLSCQDWTWLLDRMQVFKQYPTTSVENIVHDVMTSYTTGFTTVHVEDGLGTLTGPTPFTMESVSRVIQRLAADVDAFWYVDPDKDLHFFTTDRTPQPHDLSSSYSDFEDVAYSVDISQIRTRVYVEGAGSTLAERWMASTDLYVVDNIPFDFPTLSGSTLTDPRGGLRIGSYAPLGSANLRYYDVDEPLADTYRLRLDGGSDFDPLIADAVLNSQGYFPVGTPVNMWRMIQDTTAQTALAALDGSDGVRETYIQDRRLSWDGMEARGQGELDRVKNPVERLSYRTRDPNTRPGGRVTVNLAAPVSISGTFTIQSVTVDAIEEATNKHPWKTVTASASERTLWDVYSAAVNASARNTI